MSPTHLCKHNKNLRKIWIPSLSSLFIDSKNMQAATGTQEYYGPRRVSDFRTPKKNSLENNRSELDKQRNY